MKEEVFCNLCDHDLEIMDSKGKIRTIVKSNKECRVEVHPKDIDHHDEIKIFRDVYGEIINLPRPEDGVMYIVSARVLNTLNESRTDVVSPGRQIKDKKTGKVLYSVGLRRKF